MFSNALFRYKHAFNGHTNHIRSVLRKWESSYARLFSHYTQVNIGSSTYYRITMYNQLVWRITSILASSLHTLSKFGNVASRRWRLQCKIHINVQWCRKTCHWFYSAVSITYHFPYRRNMRATYTSSWFLQGLKK